MFVSSVFYDLLHLDIWILLTYFFTSGLKDLRAPQQVQKQKIEMLAEIYQNEVHRLLESHRRLAWEWEVYLLECSIML